MSGTNREQENRQFEHRLAVELVPKLKLALLVAASLFTVFIGLDYALDPEVLVRNALIRAGTVVLYLALFWANRSSREPARRAYVLELLGVALGGASLTWLSVGIRFGELLAVGSFLLMVVVLAALSTTLRRTIAAYAVLVVVFNALAPLLGASHFFLGVVDVFLISGSTAGVMMGVVTERLARRAFRLERELEELATHDSMTQTRNRASFLREAQRELDRAQRSGRPVSLLLLDIDKFKNVNDTFGHPVGDEVIRAVADTARGVLRSVDLLARIGGEEFAILLPETALEQSEQVAERVRTNVAERRLTVRDQLLSFTVSIGVATWSEDEPLERLMSRTDEALYAAKRSGRNRVGVLTRAPR